MDFFKTTSLVKFKTFENIGQLFEKRMIDTLYKEISHSKYVLVHESDLRKCLGFDAVGVDFMIISSECTIFGQCKYTRSRRRETKHIGKFVRSIEYIKDKLNIHAPCYGFWVARLEPFDDNKEWMKRNSISAISSYDSMDELLIKTINEIKKILCISQA